MAIQNALNLTATGVITHDGAGTFTGSTLTEGGVVLAGASNSITDTGVLAKGDLIVGDGTTAPSLLSVGTNDFVLTADSAEATGVKWASVSSSPSAGNWVLIESQTASNDATLNFETGIDSTYDIYIFEIFNLIPDTDSVNFYWRVGTGATPTYQSDATDYRGKDQDGSTYLLGQLRVGQSALIGSDTNEIGVSQTLRMYNPSASNYTQFHWHGSYHHNTNSVYDLQGAGEYVETTPVTAVQFFFSSGNIESGTINLYAIQKT